MSAGQTRTLTVYDTAIGKKAAVAVTGVVLFGFVIAHMLGNLQVFLGPKALNDYAESLHAVPTVLWAARLVLLGSVAVHITFTVQLVAISNAARPVGYRSKKSLASTYASRTMKLTGPLLLAFVLYHLAHFTWPGLAMGAYSHDPADVYGNVVRGFSVPWVCAIYLVAQILLGLHLYHGAWSLFQTLGLSHPKYDRVRDLAPKLVALGVVLGNLSIPLAVLSRVVR